MSDTGLSESTGHGSASDKIDAIAARQAEVQEARELVKKMLEFFRVGILVADYVYVTGATWPEYRDAIQALLDATAPTLAQE